jgi:syntaxin 18
MNSRVLGVEKSVMEIATLNQLFSSLISSQAQAIETVYDNAVEASFHISTGNQYLEKTIRVNKSTQYYIFVILAVATFCLLFFDWFYS